MNANLCPDPARLPEYRFDDNETMRNKLLYQVRTGNMNAYAMDQLQSQGTEELHRLRSELELILRELRESVHPENRASTTSIAA